MTIAELMRTERIGYLEAKRRLETSEQMSVGSNPWLAALVAAWKEYQEIDGDYTYHLQEGGDSKYTRQQWMDAWLKFDNMMKEAANETGETIKSVTPTK